MYTVLSDAILKEIKENNSAGVWYDHTLINLKSLSDVSAKKLVDALQYNNSTHQITCDSLSQPERCARQLLKVFQSNRTLEFIELPLKYIH